MIGVIHGYLISVTFPVAVQKYSDKSNLREKGFILANIMVDKSRQKEPE